MRNLVITENITLDGVIDASEGWFAPSGEGRMLISLTSMRHFASKRLPPTRCC